MQKLIVIVNFIYLWKCDEVSDFTNTWYYYKHQCISDMQILIFSFDTLKYTFQPELYVREEVAKRKNGIWDVAENRNKYWAVNCRRDWKMTFSLIYRPGLLKRNGPDESICNINIWRVCKKFTWVQKDRSYDSLFFINELVFLFAKDCRCAIPILYLKKFTTQIQKSFFLKISSTFIIFYRSSSSNGCLCT